jgi:hypothetical protein
VTHAPHGSRTAPADRSEAIRIAEAMARQLDRCGADLGDERACITCLHANWHWRTIDAHLDAALDRARTLRAAWSLTL